MAVRIDGSRVASEIKHELAPRVEQQKAAGADLALGMILVRGDPGSRSYPVGKHRDCAEVGIASVRIGTARASQEDKDADRRYPAKLGKVSGATGGVRPMTRVMPVTKIVEIAEGAFVGAGVLV